MPVGHLLRNFGAMIPLTFIVLPYALVVWPLLTARRRRTRASRTAAVTAATDVTIATVAILALCLVFMPVAGSHGSRLQLMPGTDVMAVFGGGGSCWQVVGNLVLLSPLGALLPLRAPCLRSVHRIALAALIVSMLVEGVQYLIHCGRVTATDDVLLNTIGAAAGAAASRKWWANVRLVPAPMPVPEQRRRVAVCEIPAYALRPPRAASDPTCPYAKSAPATKEFATATAAMRDWRRAATRSAS
jgi:hypothetical protein